VSRLSTGIVALGSLILLLVAIETSDVLTYAPAQTVLLEPQTAVVAPETGLDPQTEELEVVGRRR
jgi:hypothetical protein